MSAFNTLNNRLAVSTSPICYQLLSEQVRDDDGVERYDIVVFLGTNEDLDPDKIVKNGGLTLDLSRCTAGCSEILAFLQRSSPVCAFCLRVYNSTSFRKLADLFVSSRYEGECNSLHALPQQERERFQEN